MKKNIQKISVLILLIVVFNLNAQSIERQVVAVSGGALSSGSVTLDFTVGELAITNLTEGVTTLSQGFQQGIRLAIKVNPKVFLQGALVNPNMGEENLMRDDLRVANSIPLASPYGDGSSSDASVLTTTDSNAIIDWVEVALHDKNDISLIIEKQSALLQRDGDIVGLDGVSSLAFNRNEDNYYVIVSHRNHISIASATAITISTTENLVDFTTNSASIFGGSNAIVITQNGKIAMIAGDYDGNGQVQNSDKSEAQQFVGNAGYSNADIDMNNQIQNSDINSLLAPNSGKGKQF